jgi:hypothetical protein
MPVAGSRQGTRRFLEERGGQARLANAGLARDQHDLALVAFDLPPAPAQEFASEEATGSKEWKQAILHANSEDAIKVEVLNEIS